MALLAGPQEPLDNLGSCADKIQRFEQLRREKEARAPPPVITSMQKLLAFVKTRPECLAVAGNDQAEFLKGFGWQVRALSLFPVPLFWAAAAAAPAAAPAPDVMIAGHELSLIWCADQHATAAWRAGVDQLEQH